MQIRDVPMDIVWSMRREIMYPAESLEFVRLPEDAQGLHWGLYLNGTCVSIISLFEQEGTIQFRKFATQTDLQGKGYGSRLLQHVMDWAVQHGKKKIWCNARVSATDLYRKFGMQPAGETWWKYGIEFIKMEKQL